MAEAVIHVVFVDAKNGTVLTRGNLRADRLPARFVADTTLHIAGEEWAVVNAEPVTAEEFTRTGQLVLSVTKVSMLPPKNIQYTVPTLEGSTPEPKPAKKKAGQHIFELHEDSWRQIEFVAVALQGAIRHEIAEIERIFREQSVDNGGAHGFKRIHQRMGIPHPLPDGIALADIAALFPTGPRYDGVAFERMEGTIPGGFATLVGPLVLYGQQTRGKARAIGIHPSGMESHAGRELVVALARLMATHQLYLVDWCWMSVVPADPAAIHAYLNQSR